MPSNLSFFTPELPRAQLSILIELQKRIYDITLSYDISFAQLQSLKHSYNERLAQQYHLENQLRVKENLRQMLENSINYTISNLKIIKPGPFPELQAQNVADNIRTHNANMRSMDKLNKKVHKLTEKIQRMADELDSLNRTVKDLFESRMQLVAALEQEYQWQTLVKTENPAYHQVFTNVHPILIKDIIVTQPSEAPSSGEVKHLGGENYLERMIQQITQFAELAFQNHASNCIEGQLRPEMGNRITRLITDEFSFYPKNPLTVEQYTVLLAAIDKIAKTLPANIHLILSSFPVVDNQNQLHNIIVHVASGTEPVLHHHSKAKASRVDVTYGHKKLATANISTISPQMVQINLEQELRFSYGTIAVNTTAAGTQLITNVEICKEHQLRTGIVCLEKEINRAQLACEIIPLQYSHVLSSRTIDVERHDEHVRIIQADSINPGIWTRDPHTSSYLDPIPYKEITLNNIFGQNNSARIYNPQPTTFLPQRFFDRAIRHNQHLIKEQPPMTPALT